MKKTVKNVCQAEVKQLRSIWARLGLVMDNLQKKKHLDPEMEIEEAFDSLDMSIEYLRNALDYIDEPNGGNWVEKIKSGAKK